MSRQAVAPPPVRHTVEVAVPPRVAFERFAGGFGRWWPRGRTVSGEHCVDVRFAAEEGAEVLEFTAGGAAVRWGTVSRWDPPHRLALTWHPGRPEPEATHVEVVFADVGGHTEVTLRHLGWAGTEAGAARRRRYDEGWPALLQRYRRFAER